MAGGSILSCPGKERQSRATQRVIFKQLQLFYEAILGFNAACVGWDRSGLQLLHVMASGKQLGLVGLGWTLLRGVYSAVAHLGTNLLPWGLSHCHGI